MTVGIISESDSKGRAVCQFWLQGGKHNVTPTDKITYRRESPWGPLDPPLFCKITLSIMGVVARVLEGSSGLQGLA